MQSNFNLTANAGKFVRKCNKDTKNWFVFFLMFPCLNNFVVFKVSDGGVGGVTWLFMASGAADRSHGALQGSH